MSQQNGNRILQPGSVNIGLQQHPAPNATPAVVPIGGGSGELKVLMFGGLSKVEHLAGQIAAGLVSGKCAEWPKGELAREAVDIARAILEETAKKE